MQYYGTGTRAKHQYAPNTHPFKHTSTPNTHTQTYIYIYTKSYLNNNRYYDDITKLLCNILHKETDARVIDNAVVTLCRMILTSPKSVNIHDVSITYIFRYLELNVII